MANVLEATITHEGPRNAVVKITGVLTDSDYTGTVVTKSQFTSNENVASGSLVGFRVDCVQYSVGDPMQVQLAWDANSPQILFAFSGHGELEATHVGGFVPNRLNSGYNGDILLTTTGYPAGTTQVFSVILKLVKLYA